MRAWRGDETEAAALSEAAVPASGQVLGTVWDSPLWLRAELGALRGDAPHVREVLSPVWERSDLETHEETVMRMLIVAARAEADIAEHARAMRNDEGAAESKDVVEILINTANRISYPGPLGAALETHFEAELSRWAAERQPEPWRRALDAWRAIGFPYDQAWALFRSPRSSRARRPRRRRRSVAPRSADRHDTASPSVGRRDRRSGPSGTAPPEPSRR